ncbi:hypothetical protein LZC95_49735 [Pendulispora brunnea]|uniref:Uncharacterized protein n=1 Tax=Pendulispora brunnea TaxID=2905690 RepID=A0ABZ2K752_9BACT
MATESELKKSQTEQELPEDTLDLDREFGGPRLRTRTALRAGEPGSDEQLGQGG